MSISPTTAGLIFLAAALAYVLAEAFFLPKLRTRRAQERQIKDALRRSKTAGLMVSEIARETALDVPLVKQRIVAMQINGVVKSQTRNLRGTCFTAYVLTDELDAAETLQRRIRAELLHLYPPDEAQAWLASPQRLLNGRVPARMIADGNGEEVLALLRLVNDGAYV